VDYLFIDEYNRAPKKVRNGCMEIIQFRTINGVPLPRLKGIIAAINPQDPDDSYDVEDLDKAQFDRFHIKCQVPYDLCQNYMYKTFGEELAETAIFWWKGLPKEVQAKVSPRNLDYALQEYQEGGDLKDVFDPNDKALMNSVSTLSKQLSAPPIHVALKQTFDKKDKKKAKALMIDDSSRHQAHEVIRENPDYMDFYLPFYPKEVLSKSLLEQEFLDHIVKNFGSVKEYSDVIIDYVKTNPDTDESRRVREIVNNRFYNLVEDYYDKSASPSDHRFFKLNNNSQKTLDADDAVGLFGNLNYNATFYTKNTDSKADFDLHAIGLLNKPFDTVLENSRIWNEFIEYIPSVSRLSAVEAARGLELMEKLAVKIDSQDNADTNSNFFLDSHKWSIMVFNTLSAALMIKTGINKVGLTEKYPTLMEEFSFFIQDAEVGFPEALDSIFLQEK